MAKERVLIYNHEYNLSIFLFVQGLVAGLMMCLIVEDFKMPFYIAYFFCGLAFLYFAYYFIRGGAFYILLLDGCDFFVVNRFFVPQPIPYLDIQKLFLTETHSLRFHCKGVVFKINLLQRNHELLIDTICANNRNIVFAREVRTESKDIISGSCLLEETLTQESFREIFVDKPQGSQKDDLQT